MSKMYPEEEELEEEEQDEQSGPRSEAEGRTFFAFLCFFIAIILLALFVNGGLETSVKLLVLFGVIGFGILGVLIFEKKQPIKPVANDAEDEPEEQVQEEVATEEEVEESDQPRELTPFEQLVQEALEGIPAEFHDKMENLAVIVQSEPDEETLARVGSSEGQTLLGLYQGIPLTAQGYGYAMLPQQITIYQHTIERYCHGDPVRIREQVQHTVLHEVAHHFGIGHEAMPIWVR